MIVLAVAALPTQWFALPVRLQLTAWFGVRGYRPLPASRQARALMPEPFCLADGAGRRDARAIDGVDVSASAACVADNPFAVAAFVKGTNNVSHDTLPASGLAANAVVKGA